MADSPRAFSDEDDIDSAKTVLIVLCQMMIQS